MLFRSHSNTRASTALDRWVLHRIHRVVSHAPIRFVLWDGYGVGASDVVPLTTVTIRNRAALLSWALDPELKFGEA